MSMIYIQQNSSTGKKINYPSSAHPKATISSSGCGVCSSLMILLNSTTYTKTLAAWASELRKNGCRAAEGTDMFAVSKLMKKKYGFTYTTTSDVNKLAEHLKKGYKAVANVGKQGYFSNSGHYVCVAGITSDDKMIVLDPYYYTNKWTTVCKGIKRSNYFSYNSSTHEVICSKTTLNADAKGSKFFLFTPTKKISIRYSDKDIHKVQNVKPETSVVIETFAAPVNWKNGSTKEITYKDSALKNKIGSLKPKESAKCYCKTGNSYGIVYEISNTKKHKAGYVAYKGGAANISSKSKTWKNGSTKETVYADTKKQTVIGSIDPKSTAQCLAKIDGMYLVKYKINNTSNYKIGFVVYSGGVK